MSFSPSYWPDERIEKWIFAVKYPPDDELAHLIEAPALGEAIAALRGEVAGTFLELGCGHRTIGENWS
jgi:hypothetical protein